ncbi:unnamed protein product, partial [marine sediment metagenome]
ELREDRGEIEAAKQNRLPGLVKLSQIKGDLHIHTIWSDGGNSIEEMLKAAQEIGYKYLAICDHSQTLKVAGGLSEDKLLKQIEKIKELNSKYKDFDILAGSEVDIKADGSLDYSDELLEKLDIVVKISISPIVSFLRLRLPAVLILLTSESLLNLLTISFAIDKATPRVIRSNPLFTISIPFMMFCSVFSFIPGIGSGTKEKIYEILDTGRLQFYEKLKNEIPPSLVKLLSIPGVGPKLAKRFYEELDIRDIE